MELKNRFQRLNKQWTSYWFSRPAKISVEACRIALGFIYIYINHEYDLISAEAYYRSVDVGQYNPDGLLAIISPGLPANSFIDALIFLSLVSGWTMMLGIFTRLSSVLALLSNLIIRSWGESFIDGWCHGFNVIFLAHIGFLFAPIGKNFSIDFLIRKYIFKRESDNEDNGYWSVLLGQWAVALMFFSAFWWKVIAQRHFVAFLWATTDNMRNQILRRYDWMGDQMPPFIEWVANHKWAYIGFAWLTLFGQFGAIISCFKTNTPVWRFLFGMIFVFTELGLNFFFGLPDYQWLPLIVFFIDWDALALRLVQRTHKILNHGHQV